MGANTFTGTGDGQTVLLAKGDTGTAAKAKPAPTKRGLTGTGTTEPKVSRQDLAEILAQACHDYQKNGGSVRVGMTKTGVGIILAGDFYCRKHARITVASTYCQYCQDKLLARDVSDKDK